MQSFVLAIQRELTPLLAAVVAAFLALVVLPFFLYGLHLQTDPAILFRDFDPKDRFPYDFRPAYYVAALAAAFGPFASAPLAVVTPFTLALTWRTLGRTGRWAGLAMWLTGAATLLFLQTPLGHNVMVWFLD